MRLLLTGSHGRIGPNVEAVLRERGHEIVPFDAALGDDVRDGAAVRRAARGCDAAVHMAAVSMDGRSDPDTLMATNVLGSWHVLAAAAEERMRRVVVLSSVNALGVFLGQGRPDYLPIDDAHPARPRGPYGTSKWLVEELCRSWSGQTGIASVCLRLPVTLRPDDYARLARKRRRRPECEWEPAWEYGAYLDVRDAGAAVDAALRCPDPGHATVLVAAADSSTSVPTLELLERLLPDLMPADTAPWRKDPYRSLIDCSHAQALLGWRPDRRWPREARTLAGAGD